MTTERLDCGHVVNIEIGTRLFCHYDCSFGVVIELGYDKSDPWHEFRMDGSPYAGHGSRSAYNAQRLACFDCGVRSVQARKNDPLVMTDTFELVRP